MKTPRIVVLGGGYAGVLAALRAKARVGERAEVRLVSDRDTLVERIRLHELAVREREVHHSLAHLVRGTGIELQRARVDAIDLRERHLRTADGTIHHDALVIATGSQAVTPNVPGLERAHLLEPDTAPALRARLHALATGASVVVVGGGLSGIEIAAEVAEARPDVHVTLATAGLVGERLSDEARLAVLAGLEKLGVEIVTGLRVDELTATSVRARETSLHCDLCVWTVGFRASPLLERAGLSTNDAGQCRVAPTLAAWGHERVWLAGDAAAPILAPGSPIHPGCKTAMPMGAHAGENAAAAVTDRPELPFDFRDTGYCVSLGRRAGVIDARIRDRVYRGRFAAWLKEAICRYTIASLRWERSGFHRYGWLRTGRAPASLASLRLASPPDAESR